MFMKNDMIWSKMKCNEDDYSNLNVYKCIAKKAVRTKLK